MVTIIFLLTVLQLLQENTIPFPCLCLNQVWKLKTFKLYIICHCHFTFALCSFLACYQSMNHMSLHSFHFVLSLDLPPHFLFTHIPSKLCHRSLHVAHSDHTRKIELIRYLVSGYVNGKVLDTLSEHANALASTAVASLEDEADQLSHFPFLLALNDPVLTVPRHHGWYKWCLVVAFRRTCAVSIRLALCSCSALWLQVRWSSAVCRTSLQVHLGPVSSVQPFPVA